jgi:hypothetical protein
MTEAAPRLCELESWEYVEKAPGMPTRDIARLEAALLVNADDDGCGVGDETTLSSEELGRTTVRAST